MLAFAPRDAQPGESIAPIDAPVLFDATLLTPVIRELMFAVREVDVEEPDFQRTEQLANSLIDASGAQSEVRIGAALGHYEVLGRWVETGGFLYPLLCSKTGERWGPVVRASDDLVLRASIVVEKL